MKTFVYPLFPFIKQVFVQNRQPFGTTHGKFFLEKKRPFIKKGRFNKGGFSVQSSTNNPIFGKSGRLKLPSVLKS